jgi:hypothetical protein
MEIVRDICPLDDYEGPETSLCSDCLDVLSESEYKIVNFVGDEITRERADSAPEAIAQWIGLTDALVEDRSVYVSRRAWDVLTDDVGFDKPQGFIIDLKMEVYEPDTDRFRGIPSVPVIPISA